MSNQQNEISYETHLLEQILEELSQIRYLLDKGEPEKPGEPAIPNFEDVMSWSLTTRVRYCLEAGLQDYEWKVLMTSEAHRRAIRNWGNVSESEFKQMLQRWRAGETVKR